MCKQMKTLRRTHKTSSVEGELQVGKGKDYVEPDLFQLGDDRPLPPIDADTEAMKYLKIVNELILSRGPKAKMPANVLLPSDLSQTFTLDGEMKGRVTISTSPLARGELKRHGNEPVTGHQVPLNADCPQPLPRESFSFLKGSPIQSNNTIMHQDSTSNSPMMQCNAVNQVQALLNPSCHSFLNFASYFQTNEPNINPSRISIQQSANPMPHNSFCHKCKCLRIRSQYCHPNLFPVQLLQQPRQPVMTSWLIC